jgi:hypothetical protein
MKQSILRALLALVVMVTTLISAAATAHAQTPTAPPQSGQTGVEGRVPSPPPNTPATSTIPITLQGSCPNDTMIKIFSNGIFIGSIPCNNGSYTIQVSLFSGRNDIVARVFDALDQEGPISQQITIMFNDAQFNSLGNYVFITSQYARRAADPGKPLVWPIILSNGVGPYALSIDWGDGTPAELHSESFAGVLNYTHTYKTSGIYRVTFKVVDKNGTTGYLQVIAVVSGTAGTNKTDGAGQTVVTQTKILWWPVLLMFIPVLTSFWLGRRYELTALRKRLDREYR